MATIWCNGQWRDSERSGVTWSDRGLLHGLGLFETMLAVDGRIVHLDHHLDRLRESLGRLAWDLPDQDFGALGAELLVRNGLDRDRVRVRLALTGGRGGLDDTAMGQDACCWMSASPLAPLPTKLKVGLSPWRRNEHSPLAGLKCASYAENLMALDWARGKDWNEALWLNTAGNLCEASCANAFVYVDGTWITPALEDGPLPGVARRVLLELAARHGIEIVQGQITVEMLERAGECFLSSATRGVMGVAQLDGRKLPGDEGPMTRRLVKLWNERISEV